MSDPWTHQGVSQPVTLNRIANPTTDADWTRVNRLYRLSWAIIAWASQGEGRRMLLIPWPEMSGFPNYQGRSRRP